MMPLRAAGLPSLVQIVRRHTEAGAAVMMT